MTEFKKGDRIIFVEDDEHGGVEMPKGTRGTYDEDDPTNVAPSVRLDSGERVIAWRDCIVHAEDHGTGDGSASDICAAPGCNCDLERRFPAPPYEATTNPDGSVTARSNLRFVPDAPQQVEDDLFASANGSLAAALRTGPLTAPLDPSKVKPGDTVTVSVLDPDVQPEPWTVNGKVYTSPFGSALAVGMTTLRYKGEWDSRVTLTAHTPAPEPEPEWEPGTVADIYVDPVGTVRAVRARVGWYWCADTEEVYSDEDVSHVHEMVVIDPAEVDVADLRRVLANADYGFDAQARAVLEHLGIEVPR